jgi:sugar/nucleoside kinase (ribokinase family)
VEAVREDGVGPRVARVAGRPTGRIGVLVGPGGERSFVADRGAADELSPDDVQAAWFHRVDAVHLPAYSLLGEPLGLAGRTAIGLGRAEGGRISLDLASIAPLLARGRRAARQLVVSLRPDILFATQAEAQALIGRYAVEELLDFAALAVVKRGSEGATLLVRGPDDTRLRVEVATTTVATTDSTGAGDAFDAGFLASYLAATKAGRAGPSVIHRAALAGHRAARRHLVSPRPELPLF